jgi:hypothetical protein
MPYLIEAIHVELADEGGEIIMLEVLGEHNVSEPIYVFYVKSIASRCPFDILSA